MDEERAAIEIHSIMVNEGAIEISYAEEGDASQNGVLMIRTLMVPRALVQDEVAELLEAAAALIDAGLVAKRSPKASFRTVR